VLVTHDQAEALSIADQVAVLRNGRLVQLTDPRTLYRQPRDLDVAAFVGEAVVLDADVRDDVAHCVLGEVRGEWAGAGGGLHEGRARVLLRPEQLRLVPPAAGLPVARVGRVDFYGHDSRVWLDLADGSSVSARLDGAEVPSPGDEVSITVRGAARLFPADGARRDSPDGSGAGLRQGGVRTPA
jgi:iron(III) transport system ATP-binding protein